MNRVLDSPGIFNKNIRKTIIGLVEGQTDRILPPGSHLPKENFIISQIMFMVPLGRPPDQPLPIPGEPGKVFMAEGKGQIHKDTLSRLLDR